MIVIDPNQPIEILQTGQPAKYRFREPQDYKAAVGDVNQAAKSRLSQLPLERLSFFVSCHS